MAPAVWLDALVINMTVRWVAENGELPCRLESAAVCVWEAGEFRNFAIIVGLR